MTNGRNSACMPKKGWRVRTLVVDLWVQVTKTSKSSSHLVGSMYSNSFISDLTFSISWIFSLCVGLIFFLLQAYILPSKWSHRKVFLFSSKTPRVLFQYPGLSGPGLIIEPITVDIQECPDPAWRTRARMGRKEGEWAPHLNHEKKGKGITQRKIGCP